MPTPSRQQATTRAASLSVVSNTGLVVAKLAIGMVAHSVSIVSEGLHSAIDLAAALIAYFSLRKAGQPADAAHRYGHGKYESLSGLVEGLLIIVAAGFMVYVAGHRLLHGGEVRHEELGVVVMAASALVNVFVSAYLFRVAKAHESIALEADAWHLRTDVYTSVAVLVGMAAIALGAPHYLDPIAAVVVALVIIREGYRLTREATGQLLDTALPPEEERAVLELLRQHRDRFEEFHAVRSRRAGAERHVDLHLVVRRGTSIEEAHAVADHLEGDIAALFPHARVIIHLEPAGTERVEMQRRA